MALLSRATKTQSRTSSNRLTPTHHPLLVTKSTTTMLVSRFFNAVAGSAFLSVAGGTVGDLFPSDKLSLPMTIYTASPFVGPLVSSTTASSMSFSR
jgi:MFS family permease